MLTKSLEITLTRDYSIIFFSTEKYSESYHKKDLKMKIF